MTHINTYTPELIPQIKQFQTIIQENSSFLLVGHTKPDGDCLGSLLALGHWIEKIGGKEVHYTASRSHAPSMNWVWWSEKVQYFTDHESFKLPEVQVVILLDHCAPNQRSDIQILLSDYIKNKITVCIDHHINTPVPVNCSMVDASSSSACEWLWEILNYLDPEGIDKQIATRCFLGLTTDTGGSVGLEYEKDSVRSFENALGMLKAGADKKSIIQKLNEVTPSQLEYAKKMFGSIHFTKNCLWVVVEWKDIEELGLDTEQAGLAFGLMKKIVGKDVIAKFTHQDNKRYGSLRTATDIDVQQIAASFGGGGHVKAAGFRLEADYSLKDIEAIMLQIEQKVELQKKSS